MGGTHLSAHPSGIFAARERGPVRGCLPSVAGAVSGPCREVPKGGPDGSAPTGIMRRCVRDHRHPGTPGRRRVRALPRTSGGRRVPYEAIAIGLPRCTTVIVLAAMAMRTSGSAGAIVSPPARRRPWKLPARASSTCCPRRLVRRRVGAPTSGFGNVGEPCGADPRAAAGRDTGHPRGLWSESVRLRRAYRSGR